MRSVLILSVLFSALIAITIVSFDFERLHLGFQWISLKICVFFILHSKADETAEEHAKHHGISEDKMKIVNECKEQEKATDDDFQAFLSHKLQQTSTGKCLMACIYEKIGGVCVSFEYMFKEFLVKRIMFSMVLFLLFLLD